jgi:hypothetical protein
MSFISSAAQHSQDERLRRLVAREPMEGRMAAIPTGSLTCASLQKLRGTISNNG